MVYFQPLTIPPILSILLEDSFLIIRSLSYCAHVFNTVASTSKISWQFASLRSIPLMKVFHQQVRTNEWETSACIDKMAGSLKKGRLRSAHSPTCWWQLQLTGSIATYNPPPPTQYDILMGVALQSCCLIPSGNTNQILPCSTFKKFLAASVIRRFITVFTTAPYSSLSCVSYTQFTPLYLIS